MKTFTERFFCVENLLSFCKRLKQFNIKYTVQKIEVYSDLIFYDKILAYDVSYKNDKKIIF